MIWLSLGAALVVFVATRWLMARQAPEARYLIAAAGSLGCLSTSLLILTTANLIEGTPMVDPHAVVQAVIAETPAAKAGVAPGDRILAIDGVEVASGEVPQRISAVPASLSCELTIEREGAVQKIRVTPEAGRIGVAIDEEPSPSPRSSRHLTESDGDAGSYSRPQATSGPRAPVARAPRSRRALCVHRFDSRAPS